MAPNLRGSQRDKSVGCRIRTTRFVLNLVLQTNKLYKCFVLDATGEPLFPQMLLAVLVSLDDEFLVL
jgi:hypothetical protein